MGEAQILEDRRARVEMLFRLLAGRPDPQVDLGDVLGDPASVAGAVDAKRLMTHVRALAGSPRANVPDHAQALSAARYVEAQLVRVGLKPRRLEVTSQSTTLPVVWAAVPSVGGPAGPTVVLVAHYDTVPGSPGADDNASGVAGMLEISRVLPSHTLPATVVLATVPFEESYGFAGSEALAASLVADPRTQVVAAMSAEMLGYSTKEPRLLGDRGDDLLLVGFPGTERVVDTVVAAAKRWSPGRLSGLAVPEGVPEAERSDHASFHRHGIPAVMATDGAEFRNPHYHQPSDTPDTLDPDFLAGSTASLAVGLMALAAAP